MSRYFSFLALATLALAVPSPPVSPALTIVDAFRLLHNERSVEKRQYSGAGLTEEDEAVLGGLEDLLEDGISTVRSDGKCSGPCSPWIDSMVDCSQRSSYTSIGLCACGNDELKEMEVCGNCFGSGSQSDATDFAGYCRKYGASSSDNGTSASSAIASSASGTVSGFASGSAAASSTARGAPSALSTATPTDAFDGLDDLTDIASQTGDAGAAASGSSSPAEGGSNGTGALKLASGLAAGLAGGLVALLAL